MRVIGLAVLIVFPAGCASRGAQEPSGRVTKLDLTQKNYRVLKANAVGEDTGWWILCLLPVGTPQQAAAKARLYEGMNVEGKATALANLTEDWETLFLLLVCRQKLTLSADIIEFVEPEKK